VGRNADEAVLVNGTDGDGDDSGDGGGGAWRWGTKGSLYVAAWAAWTLAWERSWLYSAMLSRLGRWYSTVTRDARFEWGREELEDDMRALVTRSHTRPPKAIHKSRTAAEPDRSISRTRRNRRPLPPSPSPSSGSPFLFPVHVMNELCHDRAWPCRKWARGKLHRPIDHTAFSRQSPRFRNFQRG
jgi:hypothetical protein